MGWNDARDCATYDGLSPLALFICSKIATITTRIT